MVWGMKLSVHGDFGPLTVRATVPYDWTGTAHIRVIRWSDDDNTEECDYTITADVNEALRGVPPTGNGQEDVPLDVWGAVVALLVREHARLTTLQAVQRALGESR